ncbi:MAG: ECF-type sigma factor [Gemmatimonadaceae bacterium]
MQGGSAARERATTNCEVTELLRCASGGDRGAYDRLFSIAYDELRHVAERQLRGAGARQALDPAELVNELYLKLEDQIGVDWTGRAHFYAIAARAMRQILVDLARRRRAAKRGGGVVPTTLSGRLIPADVRLDDLLALEDVLDRLAARQRLVVECRFFGGMTEDEIARALGISTRTVQREWLKARAWLFRALHPGSARPPHA